MRYFFPLHLNGDNRGCEAIAKGTAILLNEPKENLIGLTSNYKLDTFLGLDKYYNLIPNEPINKINRIFSIIYKVFHRNKWQRLCKYYQLEYDSFLYLIKSNDIMISTGGDMMCYGDNQAVYTMEKMLKKGIKTILWACSMGEKNLTTRKLDILKKIDLIYARESLTEEFLRNLGLKNVICYPDPAFILNPEIVKLPVFFDNNIIGINITKLVLGGINLDTPFGKEVCTLIDYIINNTKLKILLLPHVLWKNQDDRILASILIKKYKKSNRVFVIETEKYNYCELRYIISKCQFFIGGRTHAVISAYSTFVPTIALGYSIKSRGIAKDLDLNSKLVIDCINYKNGNLLDSFKYMLKNEKEIRLHLNSIIPLYKNRLNELRGTISKYLH